VQAKGASSLSRAPVFGKASYREWQPVTQYCEALSNESLDVRMNHRFIPIVRTIKSTVYAFAG
jgi:hypothetical protein